MKHKIYIVLAAVIFTLLSHSYVFAAINKSFSNQTKTIVGNPPQNQPGTRTQAPPCPNNDCRQAVKDKFDVWISTSLPDEHALYAWEKLWDVSHTNFDELVRGTTVERDDSGSHRAGNTVYVRARYQREFFYIIFVHELGHYINDLPDPTSKNTKHRDLWHEKGGLTGYGQTACLYDPPYDAAKIEEDYADMLTYYLNPGVPDQTTSTCDLGIIPYANGNNQDYFNLAKEILGVY